MPPLPERDPTERKAFVLLLMLIAGAVDAIGLSETGRFFVSFMSGNLTLIGVSLGTGPASVALLPLGLVALFVAGAASATLVADRAGPRQAAAALLLVEAGLLALAAAGLGTPRPQLGIVPLPVAMGIATIVIRHAHVADVGGTYATGALVAFGIGIAGLGAGVPARIVLYRAAICAALLGGAAAGAIGRLRYGTPVLLAPALALALLGLVEIATRGRGKKAASGGR